MINITFKPQTLELEVTGHAGADEKGKDIVCSAVSMLFYTLAESLNQSEGMLKKHAIIKMEDGNGYIKCRPRKEFQGNIALIYWTVLNGIGLLAEECPEFISFKVEG